MLSVLLRMKHMFANITQICSLKVSLLSFSISGNVRFQSGVSDVRVVVKGFHKWGI